MIAISEVRSAVLADKPWTRLDELVRREMAAGRRVKDIFAELNGMTDDVEETPGITEDGSDAFLDTLEALVGNCQSQFCYTDPRKTGEITVAEFALLPRWAKVAFASRCARRVLPVFNQKWPDAPEELLAGLKYATEVGEWLAAQGGIGDPKITLSGAVVCAAYVCDAAYNADRNKGRASEVVRNTGKAIAVMDVIRNDLAAEVYQLVSKNAALSLADGIATSRDNYPIALDYAHSLIRGDFATALRLATTQNWSDESPVPPETFGTLEFPNMPATWRVQQSQPPIPTDSIEISRKKIWVIKAMNQYLSSQGGEPISIDNLSVAV